MAPLTILPADKGEATVVLDRDAYIQKAEQKPSGETTYNTLQCDPTAKQASVKSPIVQIAKPLV